MQSIQMLASKPALLGMVMIFMLSVLAVPVILPHMLHGFHIVHIMLHVGSMTLAAFLAVLGVVAFYKARTKRMGLTCLGMFMFVFAEAYMLVDTTWPFSYYMGSITLAEVGHILLLAAFCIISMGVLRND